MFETIEGPRSKGRLVPIPTIHRVGQVASSGQLVDAGSGFARTDFFVHGRSTGEKSSFSAYNGNCVVFMRDLTDPSRVLMYDSKDSEQRVHRAPVVMQAEDVGALFEGMGPEMIGEQISAGIFTLEGLQEAAREDGSPAVYQTFAHDLIITLDTVAQSVSVGNTIWEKSSDTERTGAYNIYTYPEWRDFASGVIGGEFDGYCSQLSASVN